MSSASSPNHATTKPLWLINRQSLMGVPVAIALGFTTLTFSALVVDPSVAQTAPDAASSLHSASRVLVVSAAFGTDDTADGSDRAPFKSITKALQVASAGTTIQLMAGIYSEETGEQFPLQLKPGITVQGNSQNRGLEIVIKGSGFFLSPTSARQSVTIVAANQSALNGVTVINPHPQGYGLWIESASPTVADNTFATSGHDGISVVGHSAPLIRGNYFYQNGASGITVYGTSRPELRENIFEKNGFAINVNQNAMPLIIGNRITQNKDGVVAQAKSRPILRNNSIEGNERDGLVAIAQSQPNLGTKTEPGGNFIRNNGQFDIHAKTSQELLVFGNELVKTTGQINLTGEVASVAQGGGSVVAGNSPELPAKTPQDQTSQPQIPQTTAAMPTVAVRPTPPVANAAGRSPASAPASNPIAFGQKLTTAPPVRVSPPQVSAQPAPVPPSPIPAVVPAATAPRSGSQPPPMQPVATVPVIESDSDPFPVPTDLSGKVSPPQSRQMQVVRVSSSQVRGSAEVKGNDHIAQGGNGVNVATRFPAPGAVVVPTSDAPPPVKSTATQTRKPVAARSPSRVTPPAASSPMSTAATPIRPSTPANSSPPPAISSPPSQTVPTPTPVTGQSAVTSRSDASPRSLTFTKPLPPYRSFSQPVATQATSPSEIAPAAPAVLASMARTPIPTSRVVQPAPQPPSAVPISVPTPEQRSIPPTVAVNPSSAPETPLISSNLLPVPDPNVPIGNVGRRPGVNVYGITNQRDGSSPPVPPNLAELLGVRYRVVVEADNDDQQAQVRSLVPDAFPTSSRGRRVLQAGAFGDRDKADQLVQSLSSQGLRAMVERME